MFVRFKTTYKCGSYWNGGNTSLCTFSALVLANSNLSPRFKSHLNCFSKQSFSVLSVNTRHVYLYAHPNSPWNVLSALHVGLIMTAMLCSVLSLPSVHLSYAGRQHALTLLVPIDAFIWAKQVNCSSAPNTAFSIAASSPWNNHSCWRTRAQLQVLPYSVTLGLLQAVTEGALALGLFETRTHGAQPAVCFLRLWFWILYNEKHLGDRNGAWHTNHGSSSDPNSAGVSQEEEEERPVKEPSRHRYGSRILIEMQRLWMHGLNERRLARLRVLWVQGQLSNRLRRSSWKAGSRSRLIRMKARATSL